MVPVAAVTLPAAAENGSIFIGYDKRISDGSYNGSSSYVNTLTTSISSTQNVKKKAPTAALTSSYYKQIEMSKAARERKRQEQMRL